jgi:hypothetical protein
MDGAQRTLLRVVFPHGEYEPLEALSLDTVGVTSYALTPQTLAPGLVPTEVAVAVHWHAGRRTATVRSPVVICNRGPHPIELAFRSNDDSSSSYHHQGAAAAVSAVRIVPAGGEAAVPLRGLQTASFTMRHPGVCVCVFVCVCVHAYVCMCGYAAPCVGGWGKER